MTVTLRELIDHADFPAEVVPEMFKDVAVIADADLADGATARVEFFNPDTGSIHPIPYFQDGDREKLVAWFEAAVSDARDVERRELAANGHDPSASNLEVLTFRADPAVLSN